MKVLFTVHRQYYDAIVAGTKTSEVRRSMKPWSTMAVNIIESLFDGNTCIAVFVCGRLPVHRRRIIGVAYYTTPEAALGRELSEQERKDLGNGPVIGFELREVVGT